MKNIFRIIATILFLFSCQSGIAQKILVKGLIKDKYGAPLIGASITIDNNNSGAITDLSGHYKVWLTPGRHYISVSHIGYTQQVIILKVDNNKSIERNFTMTEQYKNCNEVIVAASARPKSSNTINKNSSSEQIKSTDAKLSARQLDLPLLNNILDY